MEQDHGISDVAIFLWALLLGPAVQHFKYMVCHPVRDVVLGPWKMLQMELYTSPGYDTVLTKHTKPNKTAASRTRITASQYLYSHSTFWPT